MQAHAGASAGAMHHVAGAPGHRHAHAQADRLRECLLGGEARRQVVHAALLDARTPVGEIGDLVRPEHLVGEALAAPRQRIGDAAHVADVGADAVDHRGDGAWARWMQRR